MSLSISSKFNRRDILNWIDCQIDWQWWSFVVQDLSNLQIGSNTTGTAWKDFCTCDQERMKTRNESTKCGQKAWKKLQNIVSSSLKVWLCSLNYFSDFPVLCFYFYLKFIGMDSTTVSTNLCCSTFSFVLWSEFLCSFSNCWWWKRSTFKKWILTNNFGISSNLFHTISSLPSQSWWWAPFTLDFLPTCGCWCNR